MSSCRAHRYSEAFHLAPQKIWLSFEGYSVAFYQRHWDRYLIAGTQ